MTAEERDAFRHDALALLAPALLVVMGALGYFAVQSIFSVLTTNSVQLARITEQIQESRGVDTRQSARMDKIITRQQSINHRVTILEQRR